MTADSLHRPRRWLVLAAYLLVVGVSQMLWLELAPLLTMIQARYGVGELAASGLILVFPLIFVLLSLPAGAMTDRLGYRAAIGTGALVMAAFACVRIADTSFWGLFAGQLGIAIAQPFIVNGISALVGDWFAPEQAAVATGLGTMGMFLGMAIGLASTPPLVAATSLRTAMIANAALAIATALAVAALIRPNERRAAAPAATAGTGHFRALLADPSMRLLCALAFLGLGVFNGLTTWLEPILGFRGLDAEQAGLVGGVLILGGIVGAVVIPLISDATRRRKPYLLLCVVGALAAIHPLCSDGRYGVTLLLAALLGFFFMPAFALLLEMCAGRAGPAATGAATSLLMLAGNAGGVAVILGMSALAVGPDYRRAVLLMMGLLAVTLLMATRAPETFGAGHAPAD